MSLQSETPMLVFELMIIVGFGLITLFCGWFLRGLFHLHLVTISASDQTETLTSPTCSISDSVKDQQTIVVEPETGSITSMDAIHSRSALTELYELTQTVATNVDEHQHQVVSINEKIKMAQKGDPNAVAALVTQLVEANECVQDELQSAEEKLQQQAVQLEEHARDARTDVLTSLLNRRGLDDLLREQLAEFQAAGTPVSVMFADVDHFKKFNDTYGHPAGDEVLRGMGQVLRECCGEVDIPARYGGEEFAVVFPSTSFRDAAIRADNIRTMVQDSVFHHGGSELRVACSVGLAQLKPNEEIQSFVKRADDALYASKEAGRNRGHWHDGTEIHPFNLPRLSASMRRPRTNDKITVTPTDTRCLPSGESSPLLAAELDDQTSNVVKMMMPEESDIEKSTIAPVATDATPGSVDETPVSRLSELQPLAGILKPDVFVSEVESQVEAYLADEVPTSLMLVAIDREDIDIASDDEETWQTLTRAIFQLLKAAVRTSDVLGQYDDYTFGILMPATALAKSTQLAERLRRAVSRCTLPITDGGLRFTVSVGVSELQETDRLPELRGRCETVLQAAISAGGNCTAVHDGWRCRFAPEHDGALLVAAP